MGCMYSKNLGGGDDGRERLTARSVGSKRLSSASDLRVSRLNSSVRREEKVDGGDGKVFPIDKQLSGPIRGYYESDIGKKRRDRLKDEGVDPSGLRRVPKAAEGEQVAAGWPAWLSAAAGEAINGWVPRRADTFEKLDKIGQGTYSSVYKARDLINNKIVAIKRVRFDNLDPESVKFMAREIFILRRLDHPNIIKLEGLITSKTSCSLYLVFEYMEHDLTGLASLPGVTFTESQVKCYMQQLLSGLDHCHGHGILHRDIKGSNLLIDNDGILKIADFGLATTFDPKQNIQLTSRVVTLWYRPPELLLGASHYGVAVDLWSSGCILGELCTGKPILPGKTEVEQLHKIFKLCGTPSEDYWRKMHLAHSAVFKPPIPYRRCVADTFKDLPASSVGLLETLLSVDPSHRGTAASALRSEFFTTEPFACDPSSLPKYPPSKEIDAKLREEDNKRQGNGVCRDQKDNMEKRGPPDSRRNTAVHARADSTMMMQRGASLYNSNSQSELMNANQDKSFSGLLVKPKAIKEPSQECLQQFYSDTSSSGPLIHLSGWKKAESQLSNNNMVQSKTSSSSLPGISAARTLRSEGLRKRIGPLQPAPTNPLTRISSSTKETARASKHGRDRHMQRIINSQDITATSDASEPTQYGCGPDDEKMYLSGPLFGPSNNVDRMFKDHDRRLQEYARRARLDKNRRGRDDVQGRRVSAK